MTTSRSDRVHDYWRQSSEKFDYFVTGITGALCAYISQTFNAEIISVSPSTLELLALLTLITSVFAGFKRIECKIETHKHNHSSLYLAEVLGALKSKFNGAPLINKSTGEIMPPEAVKAQIAAYTAAQPEIEKNSDKKASEAGEWYVWRNRLLAAGFLMLAGAKVWSAYV